VGIEDIELEKTQYIDSNAHPSIKPFLITFSEWQKNDSTHACIQKNNLYAFLSRLFKRILNKILSTLQILELMDIC
jgi:hypothetical protein